VSFYITRQIKIINLHVLLIARYCGRQPLVQQNIKFHFKKIFNNLNVWCGVLGNRLNRYNYTDSGSLFRQDLPDFLDYPSHESRRGMFSNKRSYATQYLN
jgi:hypothetical protein